MRNRQNPTKDKTTYVKKDLGLKIVLSHRNKMAVIRSDAAVLGSLASSKICNFAPLSCFCLLFLFDPRLIFSMSLNQ